MTTKTIDCIDCGASVPYGRLSCPACGALLASVAGALRPPARAVDAVAPGPEPIAAADPEPDPEPIAASDPEPDPGPLVEPVAEPDQEPEAASDPEPVAEPDQEPVAASEPEPEPIAVAGPEPVPVSDPEPVAERDEVDELQPIAAAMETPPVPVVPEASRWPPLDDTEPVLEPRPYVGRAAVRDGVAASPAAYRPPAFALATATSAGPAWPTVGKRAALGGRGRSGAVDPTAEAKPDVPGATTPSIRSLELAGWLVVAGAAASILGFVLPWSRVVIGSAHTGGYFDSWGLASPTHLVVLAGLLVVLGLAVVPTTAPAWIRTGVLGLASGGILVGLAWPYVVGPLGAEVGVTLALVGGIALGIGGILASWATRHASEEPSV